MTHRVLDRGETPFLHAYATNAAAIGLYESMGFRRCAPFGPYRDDPLSPCYELRLPERSPA
jgi:ribosomal protein S18 acetylase RimI-like enzyme